MILRRHRAPLLFATAIGAAACGKPAAPAKPCERGAKLEVRVVDNGSDYMKHVYAHVGSERDGSPTDPAAIRAGIRADIDQWKNEVVTEHGLPVDSKIETDYYLRGLDRAVLERYMATFEPPPADREIRLEHVAARPGIDYGEPRAHWRTYYVVKQPMLDTRAIADVERIENRITGQPAVQFSLTPDGRQAFMDGTAKNVHKKVATMIDGVIVSAPIINETIKGGRFSLNAEDPRSADALLAKFQCAAK